MPDVMWTRPFVWSRRVVLCAACRDNTDCHGDAGECIDGLCEVCELGSNRGCGGDAPICVAGADGNTCVGCQSDFDCTNPTASQCVDQDCIVVMRRMMLAVAVIHPIV